MIFKLTEFQSAGGRYYVHCAELLGEPGPHWHIPARILNIPLEDFILLLRDKYGATIHSFNKENSFLLFSWDSLVKCRLYKNYINSQARKINFQVM